MRPSVPFYRQLRFSMIMTVLLLVTLISGTSILISYIATGNKIERDVSSDFSSTEEVFDSCLSIYSRYLRTVTVAAEEKVRLRRKLEGNSSWLPSEEDILAEERNHTIDILFFTLGDGRLAAASQAGRRDAELLAADPTVKEQIAKANQFTAIVLTNPASNSSEQKKFFLLVGTPALEAGANSGIAVGGYVLDSNFLSRLPLHRRTGVSLVSDNMVLASSLPPELYGGDAGSTPFYSSTSQLPGALDLIYESSFFRERMYLKTKYIPFMKDRGNNLLVISHPAKLILATREEFGQHFVILFFIGFCSALISVLFITDSVLNPINDLQRLVRKISEGKLDDRIDTSVSNEFTPLILQFNSMLDMIQRNEELLKERVEAKTKELQQQNIFIDNLLRSSQIMAIAATDMDMNITYFNPVAERLFGYAAGDIIGKKITNFGTHVKNQEEVFRRLIEQALEKGAHTFTINTADKITYDLSDSNGHASKHNGKPCQTIEIYLSPIRAAQQESGSQSVIGLMLMAQDISKAREMDERLHAALAELQVIIDNTMLGMILLQDGRIVRVNTTFERMFGCAFAELREMLWPVFYSSVFADKEAECWDGSGRMHYLFRRNGEDGEQAEPFWCKLRRVAIDDDQQELRRELLLFEDMSSQNEMFEKIQRLSQAVEQSSNSVVITDTEGVIEYVNRTFVKLTGYQAGEVIGRSLAMLAPDERSAAAYEAMRTAALAGQEWTGELVNRKKNGELYEESVVVSPIRNEQNEITHFVVTKENITDLKRAREQADAANKAKSEFLAKMSHEIRTPMNSIIGMTEILLDSSLPSEQRGYLENVNSSASVLLSLINDILDFSKIEAGRLELDSHPFSIRHLAEEIVATLKILTDQKGIELRLAVREEGVCSVLGDSLRIRQVLLNLVGNAIKFTRKGYVALEIDVHPFDEGHCAADFRIIDTGIGIAKEQQEKIFADFTQADNSITRNYGGTGLGLSISSHLVQMMGSKIELDSELGKGSTFSFSLLLEDGGASAAADMRRQEEEINPIGRRLDILLVEDNPANQQLAVILLVKQGHQVTVASNGVEALICLSKHSYDLVFMDMQMPMMDGLTATRFIRSFEQGQAVELPADLAGIQEKLLERLAGKHLHIIAVTANALQEDRFVCLDAGMDEYLSKPYKKASMLRTLQHFDQGVQLQAAGPPSPIPVTEPVSPVLVEEQAISLQSVRAHLIKQFELEPNDADEVLSAYAASLKENLSHLSEMINKGQGVEAGRQAHALKGGLLNLGLDELAKTALMLEKGLPKQIEAQHRKMAAQLTAALRELIA